MVSTRKANEIVQRAFQGKAPRRKTFYIKFGPPASGKGGIMKHVMQRDRIDPDSLIDVDVDWVIQQNEHYEAARQQLDQAQTTQLQALYRKYRDEADVIADEILNRAIRDSYDIAWETTGNSLAWTLQEVERLKRHGYTVKVVYPLVPLAGLLARAKARQAQTGQTAAPPERITQAFRNAARNIVKLKGSVDEILIYDNSGAPGSEAEIVTIRNEPRLDWDKDTSTVEVVECALPEASSALFADTFLQELINAMCPGPAQSTADASAVSGGGAGQARQSSSRSAVHRMERTTGRRLLGLRRAHNRGWIRA